jgi:hypothetical protein
VDSCRAQNGCDRAQGEQSRQRIARGIDFAGIKGKSELKQCLVAALDQGEKLAPLGITWRFRRVQASKVAHQTAGLDDHVIFPVPEMRVASLTRRPARPQQSSNRCGGGAGVQQVAPGVHNRRSCCPQARSSRWHAHGLPSGSQLSPWSLGSSSWDCRPRPRRTESCELLCGLGT